MSRRAKQRTLSISEARRICLTAQGFNDPAPRSQVDRRHLRRVMGRLGLLQMDSVPVVMRTQYLPFFSRLGPYDPDLLDRVAYRDDEWFEAWCHEASLMPVESEPLMRWHKQLCAAGDTWKGLVEFAAANRTYVDEVLDQVRQQPLAPAELEDPRPTSGQWWGSRSGGSLALDWLFRIGEVGIRRRAGFAKEFDLLERIVPSQVLARSTPSEGEAHRQLLLRAAASLGVATPADIIDYHRLPKRPAKERLAELVENGELEEARVEGWESTALVHPDSKLPRRVQACTLLSPFDPVVWFRPRGLRLFGFDYKLEIYKPAAQRQYGYYVLPLLLGDTIVGRIDGKTDRNAKLFRVFGAFAEPGQQPKEVVEGLRSALDALSLFVGADGWVVDGNKGDLIPWIT